MSFKHQTKSETDIVDENMENVELHRANSMVTSNGDQIKSGKLPHEQINKITLVYEYVGNKARSLGSIFVQISAEMVMFMYMFSYIMRSITSTSMILDKVCLVHLKYSEDTCRHLTDFPEIKSEVEKMANNYHLGHSFLMMAPSAFLALFIGSWSDKYGRKLPIIAALVGIILDGFGITLCAHFFYSRVEYYFISACFTGLSGGFIGVMMVLYSYASDVTSSGKRTMKYAFMEVAMGVAFPLGALAGGWLFKYSGYYTVFLTSTCGHIVALFWVIFFLEETKGLDNKDPWKEKFVNFWSLEAVKESFNTTIKKRPNNGRKQLWLLILGMSIIIFSFASLSGIAYFFVHHQFNWENTTYSTVSAVYQVIGLGMMLVIVPLSKKWKIGDPALGIVGSVSLILKNVAMGLSYKVWIYHLANLTGLLSTLGSLAGRSRISKIVSNDDLGKVFAFLTTAESILPIVATAIVSQVFNLTLDFFPGFMFVVMGVLGIIPLVGFIWIARLPFVNYEEMDEEAPPHGDVQIKDEEIEPVKY